MTPRRSLRRTLTAITFLLLALAARAQDLRYLHHQSWSTEDGLPQNSVHAILQSADGFLWIATESGLARFDGLTFQTFSRANTPAFASDDICCLANDPSGDLFIGTADGTLRLHNHTFTRATPPPGLLSPSAPASQLWTYTNSTVTLTTPTLHRQWTASQGLPGSRIETLFVDPADPSGTAWVGTNDGLATLTPTSPVATPIPALRGNVILSIDEDREGNHWIGSETSGLHLLNPVKFRTEPALAEKALTALTLASNGDLWFGTRKDGLLRLRNSVLDTPVKPETLTSPIILSLAPGPQGSIWAGTPDGLNLIAPAGPHSAKVTQITSTEGLPDDYIQALLPTPDGGLWIGTRHGLAHLTGSDPKSLKITTLTKRDGLAGDLIGTLLLTSRNTLWIATSGGLSRLTPNSPIVNYPLPNIVTALAEDPSGVLWIATRGGALTRLASGHLTTLPPLSEEIAALTPDTHGFLWLRTTHGIARIALADLNRCADNPCTPPISRYTTADGIPSIELASAGSPVLLTLPTGELWSTTRRGVAIADPQHLPLNLVPPLLALERFLVDDTEIPTTPALNLPYNHTRFTMDYAALSFTAPSEVRYRYRLQPFDPAWTEAGPRRSATYTNLPPGAYAFRVQAINNDGLSSPPTTLLTFRIIPPIYRRWWFLTLAVLILAALAITLYRLRLRRIQSRFQAVLKERNRLAREIHDTLAQDFVGVSIQLDLTAQFLSMNLVPAALEQVAAARKLVTDGLADARQSIWNLRANLDSNTAQDSLPTRLRKVVERYSTETLPIRCKIGGAFRNLAPHLENEVLRIAQESLSNVQRHSHATQASIELRYGGDMLVLTVADDGRGFSAQEAASRAGHYGLGGMKERAETIAATLDIVSAPSAGTRITLSAPIPGVEAGQQGPDQQGREAAEE